MNCFYCNDEITWEKNEDNKVIKARYIMLALDNPYINLFFHKECYNKMGDFLLYITKNGEIDYNLIVEYAKKSGKTRKNGKI